MSVDVKAQVQVYQDDDSEWGQSELRISVESHWSDPDAVVIEIEGRRYTVIAHHMQDALKAATIATRR